MRFISMKARAILAICAILLLLCAAWALWSKPRLGEVVLRLPTEYGEALFRPAGTDLRLDLRGQSLSLAQTKAARLLRVNDTGGFYLLHLDKTARGCASSLIYLMLTDEEIAFSEEFGACLSEIEAFEDWSGIFVTGRTAEGETARFRLEHTGAVRLMPAA